MPPISVLIKPSSSNCNLKCKYCFYHSIAENRQVPSYGTMSLETLEVIVRKVLDTAEGSCTFIFQGGEPTLIGLDFYKKLVEYENAFNTNKIKICNAIQTNGLLIDKEWAEFLSTNRFLTGLSLDGPKDIHDVMRYGLSGKGTFTRVIKALELLKKYKVEYNILFVVHSYTARHVHKVYSFFRDYGCRYLQFIPCLDPLDNKTEGYDYSLTPERYAYFLQNLFDHWYEDIIKGNKISIQYFDNLIQILMGYPPQLCGMLGRCSCQYVIEADGGVYPCDFYVVDNWYLGNIKDENLNELKYSEKARKFIEASLEVDPACAACRWYTLCRGGCRRTRESRNEDKLILNYYCEAYKAFFEYSICRLHQLASLAGRF